MARYACRCHQWDDVVEPTYNVDISERLKALMPDIVSENTVVKYTFNCGHETLSVHTLGQGSMEYAGPYHPNVYCEGEGVCYYCGGVMSYG
jgi:hypothetical protein